MSKIPTQHLFGHASLVQNQMNYNSLNDSLKRATTSWVHITKIKLFHEGYVHHKNQEKKFHKESQPLKCQFSDVDYLI
jgi:hypothetical protein